MKQLCRIVGIMLIATGATTVASAQINVPSVPLPQLPRLPVGTDPVTGTLRTATSTLTEARKLRVREILRTERATVESDPDGQPILRRQVGALSPTPAALEGARAAGFKVLRTESLDALGLSLVVLEAPDGMSTRHALKALRELDPEGQYDYNHLYLGAGAASEETAPTPAAPAPVAIPPDCAHRTHRQRCGQCAPRARGREDRAPRMRWRPIPGAARNGRGLDPRRPGREIREHPAGRDALCSGHLLRSWWRVAFAARGRTRLDGTRTGCRREHQPGRREEPPAHRPSCAR
jgi:hypothetical protein